MRAMFPPLSAWASAMVAVAVGFGGTIALVVQAFTTLGGSVDQTGSAVAALCLGIGITGAFLSARARIPVVLAWSTPGAALLITAPSVSWPMACGAFLVAGALSVAFGAVPALARLAAAIPAAIASAMLAGVLLPFGLEAFRQASLDPVFVALLTATYVAGRGRVPLYSLLLVLAVGIALVLGRGDLGAIPSGATIAALMPTALAFDAQALLSIAVPLFVVTLVSQSLPGIVVLQLAGYSPRPAPLFVGTGLASMAAAFFGGHAINLAAITAAICTGPEALLDARRRWHVGLIYAGCYLLLAIFAPVLVRAFVALPHMAIAVLTGIAVIPALTAALESMLATRNGRDAAVLTFLVTASGTTLGGIGSAFWGVLAGLGAVCLTRLVQPRVQSGVARN